MIGAWARFKMRKVLNRRIDAKAAILLAEYKEAERQEHAYRIRVARRRIEEDSNVQRWVQSGGVQGCSRGRATSSPYEQELRTVQVKYNDNADSDLLKFKTKVGLCGSHVVGRCLCLTILLLLLSLPLLFADIPHDGADEVALHHTIATSSVPAHRSLRLFGTSAGFE